MAMHIKATRLPTKTSSLFTGPSIKNLPYSFMITQIHNCRNSLNNKWEILDDCGTTKYRST